LFIIFFTILHKNEEKKSIKLKGKTMGTYWQVKIPYVPNQLHIKNLIQRKLDEDEKLLSSWKKNSLVSKFNKLKKNQLLAIDKKFFKIISIALKINKKTYGKLDITIGNLINIWGFGNQKKPHNYPSINKIKQVMALTGMKHLSLISNANKHYIKKNIDGMKINLSTLGEGFAADHLSSVLKKEGIENYTISIGGTVLVKIKNKENSKIIAIQKPTDKIQSIHLLIHLKNKSISTAGTYRNYYYLKGKKISHLIDPKTGMPVTHNLISVSVISSTALEADGWDSALLILGFKKAKILALRENLAVCLITKKNNTFSTWISPCFKKFLINT
jgi:thiamine biosynthesis lipoprotein